MFRELYKMCGQQGKAVTFLMTEAEMKDETFLEIMNSFLMTGEVPNLFPKVRGKSLSEEVNRKPREHERSNIYLLKLFGLVAPLVVTRQKSLHQSAQRPLR